MSEKNVYLSYRFLDLIIKENRRCRLKYFQKTRGTYNFRLFDFKQDTF